MSMHCSLFEKEHLQVFPVNLYQFTAQYFLFASEMQYLPNPNENEELKNCVIFLNLHTGKSRMLLATRSSLQSRTSNTHMQCHFTS